MRKDGFVSRYAIDASLIRQCVLHMYGDKFVYFELYLQRSRETAPESGIFRHCSGSQMLALQYSDWRLFWAYIEVDLDSSRAGSEVMYLRGKMGREELKFQLEGTEGHTK